MALQFKHIFAGERGGRTKLDCYTRIKGLAMIIKKAGSNASLIQMKQERGGRAISELEVLFIMGWIVLI